MLNLLKLYGVTLAAFFAIDMLWLGLIAHGFYRKHLGFFMAPTTNWVAAIIFYLLFILGILFFVVLPGLEAQVVARDAAASGIVRADYVCDLSFDQPGHVEGLADSAHGGRYHLGRGFEHAGEPGGLLRGQVVAVKCLWYSGAKEE